MNKLFALFLCLLPFGVTAQNMIFNAGFEYGDNSPCGCATGFSCYNDAARVVDGIHPLFNINSQGCAGSGNNAYRSPLGAHNGTGYVYFYAGGDSISQSPNVYFPSDTIITMCVWYSGPQGFNGSGQNTPACHFTFGLDGDPVGPDVLVPVNTGWTQHSLAVSVTEGYHTFSIQSGNSAVYSIWFDDFSVGYQYCLPNVYLGQDRILCSGQTILLDVTTANATYLWQDNSTGPTFTVSEAGTYWVELSVDGQSVFDTINVVESSAPGTVFLGNDTILCVGEELLLDASAADVSYLWQNGSTQPTFLVQQAGSYSVQLSNTCGNSTDQVTVSYRDVPSIELGNDTALCTGQSLVLDASSLEASYLWQDNSSDPQFNVFQPGTYHVEVSNACGAATDSINISYTPLPIVDLGADTLLCDNASLLLDASAANASYVWHDNSSNATYLVTTPGSFWVEIEQNNCSARDSITIVYNSTPTVDFGADTILCEGVTMVLYATAPSADYLWQDNSTESSFTVMESGFYWLQVSNACGQAIDSISVNYAPVPLVDIGNDTSFCSGGTITLDATTENATYLWQDNATTPTYVVTEGGTYWVEVSACGIVSDTIHVIVNQPLPTIITSQNILSCSETFATYQWYLNGDPILGATNQSYTATVNGNYLVEVTDINGCIGTSFILEHTLETGIVANSTSPPFSVFPNPSSGIFHLRMDNSQAIYVEVMNARGKKVFEYRSDLENELSFELDVVGMYHLRLVANERQYIQRIMVK